MRKADELLRLVLQLFIVGERLSLHHLPYLSMQAVKVLARLMGCTHSELLAYAKMHWLICDAYEILDDLIWNCKFDMFNFCCFYCC